MRVRGVGRGVEAATVGGRDQVLDDLELAGLARVGDRADDVVAGAVRQRTAYGRAGCLGFGRVLFGAAGLALDRLLVVGEGGRRSRSSGDLADGVVAGVERLLAGRAAVAGVRLLGRGVDLEVEAAAVGGRDQVLDDLELAGLARVGDRADDVVAGADRHRQRAGRVGADRRDDGAAAVAGLALDRLLVVGEGGRRSRSSGDLADGVVAGVERLLAGRAAVAGVRLLGRGVDLEVEAEIGRASGREIDDLELAGLARVGDRADDVVAGADRHRQRAGRVGADRRDDRVAAVAGLPLARLLVVGDAGVCSRSAGDLADGVVAGVERLLAGRAAVAGVRLLGRGVDLEVEAAAVGGRDQVLDDLELACVTTVVERTSPILALLHVDRDGGLRAASRSAIRSRHTAIDRVERPAARHRLADRVVLERRDVAEDLCVRGRPVVNER